MQSIEPEKPIEAESSEDNLVDSEPDFLDSIDESDEDEIEEEEQQEELDEDSDDDE